MAKIIRKELVAVLEKVAPGIGTKENDMQITCMSFFDGVVYTFNDEVSVSALLPDALSHLECAVQAKEFIALLNKMKDEEIDVEQTESGLHIKGRRIKADIIVEKDIKMPIDEIDVPEKWRTLPDDFIVALKACLPIVSKDMSKPLSTCIYLQEDKIQASDVDRACRYILPKNYFKKPVYLPGTSVKILLRFDVKKFNVSDGWIHFKCDDDTVLSCRTYYEGQEFADITALLEAEGTDLQLPSQLVDALERSGIFVSSLNDTEVIMQDKYVQLTISDGWCKVRAEGSLGVYEEKMKIKYEGDPISFCTKVQTLKDALERNQQCEVCDRFVKIYDEQFTHLVAVLFEMQQTEVEHKPEQKTKVKKKKRIEEQEFDPDNVPF